MNPIFRREFLARWRDWRSHALLLFLALLLSGAAYWSYQNALSFEPATYQMSTPSGAIVTYMISPITGASVPLIPESLATRAARAGHALFQTLTLGNIAILFVLAPLLTATGVVRERERGLLESLQLSHMSSRSQVVARALSALVFLGALQLVTLPIDFVAFSFGSVSVVDIARAWLLAGATATVGVGLGLMISSQAARPSGALFGVVSLLFLWSVAAGLALSGGSSQWGFLGLGPQTLPVCAVLFYSHPLALAAQLLDPLTLRSPTWYPNVYVPVPVSAVVTGTVVGAPRFMPAAPITFHYWTALQVLPLALLGWTCVGALGLFKASFDVTRAFAPSGWAGRNTLIERWKRRREARVQARRTRAGAGVEGALLADLPFDKWIHFKNPLLNREVKGRFRLRRASALVWVGRTAVFLAGVSAWLMAGTLVFDPVGRRGAAPFVLWAQWVLGVVLVGTFAASGFARERESGTWEGVRLSLLPDGQIARTKWASPLIAFALLSSPLWGLLFLFLPIGSWNGAPFRVLFGGALVVASSIAFVSALATWVSLRARSTTSATCWTLGLLLALLVAVPAAWEVAEASNRIALSVVGVPADAFGRSYDPLYGYSTTTTEPSYRALYEQETGRILSLRYTKTIRPRAVAPLSLPGAPPAPPFVVPTLTPDSQSELKRYAEWLKLKRRQSFRLAAFTRAWNPFFPLVAIGQASNGRASDEALVLDDNDIALLSLCHMLLCALSITLLLWLVTRRLHKQRD